MVLRMKNILKIRLLGAGGGEGGGSWKTNIEGGLLKKGELGQSRFKGGGLRKKEGSGVFEGGVDTPMHTMPKKGDTWTVRWFKGGRGLGKKEGDGVFEGVWGGLISQCTLWKTAQRLYN